MNEHIYLTQQSYQALVAHLLDFKEKRDEIIDEYFPQLNQDRLNFTRLTAAYQSLLSTAIKNIKISEKADGHFPFIIIGSTVTVRDLASQEVFTYKISEPTQGEFSLEDVSYLSPVGRALLLKKPGETVTVKTPAGLFNYEVLDIIYNKSFHSQHLKMKKTPPGANTVTV